MKAETGVMEQCFGASTRAWNHPGDSDLKPLHDATLCKCLTGQWLQPLRETICRVEVTTCIIWSALGIQFPGTRNVQPVNAIVRKAPASQPRPRYSPWERDTYVIMKY